MGYYTDLEKKKATTKNPDNYVFSQRLPCFGFLFKPGCCWGGGGGGGGGGGDSLSWLITLSTEPYIAKVRQLYHPLRTKPSVLTWFF